MKSYITLTLTLSLGCSPSTPDPQAQAPSSGHETSPTSQTSPTPQTSPTAPISPATPPAPPPPPPPESTDLTPPGFPVPPPYVEVQTRLRSASNGAQCFQHNVIQADLTESFADGDLDGDRHPERVWQTPDCLVVITQGTSSWTLSRLVPRTVRREINRVRLRITGPSANRVLEVTDTREAPITRETYRFRWDGHELNPLP